jgi:tRNA(Met) C34 N-acetyltransferase TmcA
MISFAGRQNDLTGEHTCIMIKTLSESGDKPAADDEWLVSYFTGNITFSSVA